MAPDPLPFWAVFAVFFPAVTGIEAGLSMSGDLKNPSRSLPLGTVATVLTGFAIYISLAWFANHQFSREFLRTSPTALLDAAWWRPLAIIGLWGAALSSALGSLLAAPRIMQAMANDRILPRFLGKGYGPTAEPRTATLLSFLLALVAIMLGDLNAIGTVLTMFFLTSYGMLNLAAGLEGFVGNPSWRPTFRSPCWISLSGAAACLATMLMINGGATLCAGVVIALLFLLMKKRNLGAAWMDMRRVLMVFLARMAIYAISKLKKNARSWRPNVLVLSGSVTSRWHLIALADALTHGKGFLTVASIVPTHKHRDKPEEESESVLTDYLAKRDVPAIVELAVANTIEEGAEALIRYYGLGPVRPNTILMGVAEDPETQAMSVRLILLCSRLKRNVVLVREGAQPLEQVPMFWGRNIHVWTDENKGNNAFIIALAFMLQTSPEWRGADLDFWRQVFSAEEEEARHKDLRNFVQTSRLSAGIRLAREAPGTDIFQSMHKGSGNANFILTGLRQPRENETVEAYLAYYRDLLRRSEGLPAIAFILAGEEMDFEQIFI